MDASDKEHLEAVQRHISNVRSACELLAQRLIANGEDEFALALIANAMTHDQSKLHGIEWAHLRPQVAKDDPKMFTLALEAHQSTNEHHPEYWGGLNEMPRIYIAEMVCDWYARSTEMGTGLRGWIKEDATKKYDMSLHGKAYKHIKGFVDILLDPEFKPIPKEKEENAAESVKQGV
jgi:hypothetical protein